MLDRPTSPSTMFILMVGGLVMGGCSGGSQKTQDTAPQCPDGGTYNSITGECTTGTVGGDTATDPSDTSADTDDESDTGRDTGTDRADTGGSDTSTTGDTIADTTASDTEVSDTSVADADTSTTSDTGPTAALTGTITRESGTEPEEDGKGNLYIAVMDREPISNQDSAKAVAYKLIKNTDFSSASASVDYTITGIPTRTDKYYLTAFLDDDGTASGQGPSEAGPDTGDLVALKSTVPPESYSKALTKPQEYTLDMALNFKMF
ncbi:MAG: hypothetical protein ABEN55_01975 [Bradymonadaceae bacterium]